ncbi:MAG TPA: TGS domain-containing protein, partial [Archangium sp.]
MADQITVTLPDGSQKQAARGTTIADFVRESIGAGLAKAALFARVNGQDVDLTRPLNEDVKLQIFTSKSPEGLDLIRHD